MSKRKGKKHRVLYKAIKPYIKDDRVLIGMLGALAAGVALATNLGPDKAGDLVHKIASVLKGLGQHRQLTEGDPDLKPEKAAKAPKTKKVPKEAKGPKPFAIENI